MNWQVHETNHNLQKRGKFLYSAAIHLTHCQIHCYRDTNGFINFDVTKSLVHGMQGKKNGELYAAFGFLLGPRPFSRAAALEPNGTPLDGVALALEFRSRSDFLTLPPLRRARSMPRVLSGGVENTSGNRFARRLLGAFNSCNHHIALSGGGWGQNAHQMQVAIIGLCMDASAVP